MAASYMKIFFKIFKVTDHMAHYQMMMDGDFVDLDPDEPNPEAETETELSDSAHQLASIVENPASPILVALPIEREGESLGEPPTTAPTKPTDLLTLSPEDPDSDIPF
ncbi:hypothetical protein D3C84_1117270 [compost metagenome]